jgi:hypothetical protein
LISPSGNVLTPNTHTTPVTFIETEISGDKQFDVVGFVAHETGAYKILVEPVSALVEDTTILLEFLNPTVNSLPLDTLTYSGPFGADPNYKAVLDANFWWGWNSFSATKGEKFRLDVGIDYADTNQVQYHIDIWHPCGTGYRRQRIITDSTTGGTWDVLAAATGDIYVSILPWDMRATPRYGLYAQKISAETLTLNTTQSVRISRDERKALDFTLEEDTFIRANISVIGNGGAMMYGWDNQMLQWTAGSFSYLDSLKPYCVSVMTPAHTKDANYSYMYYFLPAGDYECLIRNSDITDDSTFMITTTYVEYDNYTIYPQALGYNVPKHKDTTNPTAFYKYLFEADDYEQSLKKAKWVYVNITKPGEYYINVSVWEVDNPHTLAPYVYPSLVYVMNNTDNKFYDRTALALGQGPHDYFDMFSVDGDSEDGDALYIAYPQKWHDIELNFTTLSGGGDDGWCEVWVGNQWIDITDTDGTNAGGGIATQNGTITLTMSGLAYHNWERGGPFDIPGVEERLYYWVRIYSDDNFSPVPQIRNIRLSNTTLTGDVNMAWVTDSPYQYCDFYGKTLTTADNLGPVSLLPGYDSASSGLAYFYEYEGVESPLAKLLMIPENWSYTGDIVVGVSVYCFNNYEINSFYNITANPIINAWQIAPNVNAPLGNVMFNYSTYPAFAINHYFNSSWYTNPLTGRVRYIINCTGGYLNWTQLIIATQNVTNYNIYLAQDLPWISNTGPNNENITLIWKATDNATYEFGVLNKNFYLIIDLLPDDDRVTLKVGITQYDIVTVYTVPPEVEIPAVIPGFAVML